MRDMEVTFATLADFASVSADNKLNVMGIWDQINTSQMPAQVLSPYLVIRLHADITEVDSPRRLKITLVDEDGGELLAGEQEIVVARPVESGVAPIYQVISRFPALQFPKPGSYKFAILIDNDHKVDIALRVNLVKQEEDGNDAGS